MTIAGDIIIYTGAAFILIGVIGLLKFKSFYTRILVTAKIDTVGVLTVLIGIAVKHGFNFFSFKVLLLMILIAIVTPLANHMIARYAYLSGHEVGEEEEKIKGDHL